MTTEEYPELDGGKFVIQNLQNGQIKIGAVKDGKPSWFKPKDLTGEKEAKDKGFASNADYVAALLKNAKLLDPESVEEFKTGFNQLMNPEVVTEENSLEPSLEAVAEEVPATTTEAVAVEEPAQEEIKPIAVAPPVTPKPKPTAPPVTATAGKTQTVLLTEEQKEKLTIYKKDLEQMLPAQQAFFKSLSTNVYHKSIDEMLLYYDDLAEKAKFPTYWIAQFSKDAHNRNAPFIQEEKREYCIHAWFVDGEGNVKDTVIPLESTKQEIDLQIEGVYNIPDLGYAARCIAKSGGPRKVDTVSSEQTIKLKQLPIPVKGESNLPTTKEVFSHLAMQPDEFGLKRLSTIYKELEKSETHTGYRVASGTVIEVNEWHKEGEEDNYRQYFLVFDDYTLKPPISRKAFRVKLPFPKGQNPWADEEDVKKGDGKSLTVFGYFEYTPAKGTYKPQINITPEFFYLG